MKTASPHAAETSSGRPVSSDKRREAPLPGCFVFERCRGVRGWMNTMDARSNDGFCSANRAAAPLFPFRSLSPSLSLYAKAVISRGSIPVAFMIYRCSRLSFAVFLRGSREIYLVARALLLLYTGRAGRGVPTDASITGSGLHPGSLRTGPTVSLRGKTEGGRRRVERSPRRYPSDTLSAEVASHHGGLKTDRRQIRLIFPSRHPCNL